GFQPRNSGILLDKYRSENPPSFENGDHRKSSPKFTRDYLERAEKGLAILGDRFGVEPKDRVRVALKFVLKHEGVTGVIPGFRTVQQVKDIVIANKMKELNGEDMKVIYNAFRA
ncbi:MAG: hypothetical protein GY786_01905, partial [Proteobacteria bacterium]|nr:hypothetical protein [Pseudomonadota bacterium]